MRISCAVNVTFSKPVTGLEVLMGSVWGVGHLLESLKTVQAAIMHITRDLKSDGLLGPAAFLILLLNSSSDVLIS